MPGVNGVFIAIDGPKSVGKTTVLAKVKILLLREKYQVIFTKEPTTNFRLDNEQDYTGIKLARLLIADRAEHLSKVIEPAIAQGHTVVTDRYIASMLAFQGLDGVSLDTIWRLNQGFRLPDCDIFLTANPASIRRRRAARARLTRLEAIDPKKEVAFYQEVQAFMEAKGVPIVTIGNGDAVSENDTAQAIAQVICAIEAKHA